MAKHTDAEFRDALDTIEKSLKKADNDTIFQVMSDYELHVLPNVVIDTANVIRKKNGGGRKTKKVRRRSVKK